MKSREVMWQMPLVLEVLWYVLAAVSIGVFAYGVLRPVLRYRQASRVGLPPRREWPRRFLTATRTVVGHRTIASRSRAVGWAHRGIFYGWLTLFAGTVIVAVDSDIAGPLFGVHFFRGDFYLGAKAALNLLGTALIAGLLVMMYRRAVLKPRALEQDRPADRLADAPTGRSSRYRRGDWVSVIALLVIAITGFLLEGVRIAMDSPGYGIYQFGGWLLAQPLGAVFGDQGLTALRHGLWWFHGLIAIAFVAAIPYTKAAHMFSSFVSLALRDPAGTRQLRDVPLAHSGRQTDDLSALHLLELDACTRCGRCHDVCPATAMGLPLSPRDVVLDLQAAAREQPPVGGVLGQLIAARPSGAAVGPAPVRPETVWSCMQCNACVEVCPVGIEQAPIINQLRRGLIEDGELAPTLQAALEAVSVHGNSFGHAAERRGDWTQALDFRIADAREQPVELLWFVGDYASFDERSREVTRATARLFHAAGLDFGILYESERTSGNDIRRVGEEGLFETLARANVAAIGGASFQRIVTTDPHSLNTLRNEYPKFGGEWKVVHHAQVLLEAIESGALDVRDRLAYRVTYHDPCHLGRMNGDYESPRRILELLGCELAEMPRNRANSFCCGAGGGKIWMPDTPGTQRPSENRIEEALGLGEVDFFVVTCPKDVTMYEDAIRNTPGADSLELRELTELTEEALTIAARPLVAS